MVLFVKKLLKSVNVSIEPLLVPNFIVSLKKIVTADILQSQKMVNLAFLKCLQNMPKKWLSLLHFFFSKKKECTQTKFHRVNLCTL
jgi:hypothetical protein